MFKKILIANRGEIALRIVRACKELGITSVVAYSQADENSLPVQLADESICIGPPKSDESYLNLHKIIATAKAAGVDAIHPGYGFLAENALFAESCAEQNIKFIGPSPECIRLMGDKATAKYTMEQAKVPTVKGTGLVHNLQEADAWIQDVGYPIIIKASAGGGGKGMRIVTDPSMLEDSFRIAKSEGQAFFGNGDVYFEKYIEKPRHVEIQIAADQYGNAIHFGERDCSIQRRHQKLVEEAPSPVVTPEIRQKMGEVAVQAVRSIGYEGLGTIEFLFDASGNFYFMEMNTRLQVEHPVTEYVTGIDLVVLQIKIAAGEALPYTQDDIQFKGHAIECRINAENPYKDFAPSPGKITGLIVPGGIGVRVESHLYTGYTIPPFYDSLVSKLVVWGSNREEARRRALRALDEYAITGISTTIQYHQEILNHPAFIAGDVSTNFIKEHLTPVNHSV